MVAGEGDSGLVVREDASGVLGCETETCKERPLAYPLRGPIRRPSVSYRTGPFGGPTSDKNAYILGQILVKDRSRSL